MIFSFTQLRSKAWWNSWLKHLRGHTIIFCTDQWLGDQPLVELAKSNIPEKNFRGWLIDISSINQWNCRLWWSLICIVATVFGKAKLNYLRQLCHPYLMKLVGHCLEDELRLLVNDFMPSGAAYIKHVFRNSLFLP